MEKKTAARRGRENKGKSGKVRNNGRKTQPGKVGTWHESEEHRSNQDNFNENGEGNAELSQNAKKDWRPWGIIQGYGLWQKSYGNPYEAIRKCYQHSVARTEEDVKETQKI